MNHILFALFPFLTGMTATTTKYFIDCKLPPTETNLQVFFRVCEPEFPFSTTFSSTNETGNRNNHSELTRSSDTDYLLPKAEFLNFFDGGLGSYCDTSAQCRVLRSHCLDGRCRCADFEVPDHLRQKCVAYQHHGPGICDINEQCDRRNGWKCKNRRCVPTGSGDNHPDKPKIAMVIGVTVILVLMAFPVCLCLTNRNRKCCSQHSDRERRRIPYETSTSSTLELFSELNDVPPNYSDVFIVRPSTTNATDSKPPSYEEAIKLEGWTNHELFLSREEANLPSYEETNVQSSSSDNLEIDLTSERVIESIATTRTNN